MERIVVGARELKTRVHVTRSGPTTVLMSALAMAIVLSRVVALESAADLRAEAGAAIAPATQAPTKGDGADAGRPLDPSTRQFIEEPLPDTTDGLLTDLSRRAKEVESLLREGAFASIWFPALRAKDVALALEEHHSVDLPDRQRRLMTSAVKRLTVVAWQIDSAGDLGNREKLDELYKRFAAVVAEIESLYASTR
jgi:hypothetical protein